MGPRSLALVLSRNIRLLQDRELMLPNDLLGDVVVLHAEANDRFAIWVRNEQLEIVDVQFSFEQRRDQAVQFLGRIHFHHEQLAFRKREIFLMQ